MKIILWAWVSNQGDGSPDIHIFPTEALAQAAYLVCADWENPGQRLCNADHMDQLKEALKAWGMEKLREEIAALSH